MVRIDQTEEQYRYSKDSFKKDRGKIFKDGKDRFVKRTINDHEKIVLDRMCTLARVHLRLLTHGGSRRLQVVLCNLHDVACAWKCSRVYWHSVDMVAISQPLLFLVSWSVLLNKWHFEVLTLYVARLQTSTPRTMHSSTHASMLATDSIEMIRLALLMMAGDLSD
jgi:hypothetical protein